LKIENKNQNKLVCKSQPFDDGWLPTYITKSNATSSPLQCAYLQAYFQVGAPTNPISDISSPNAKRSLLNIGIMNSLILKGSQLTLKISKLIQLNSKIEAPK